MTLSTSPRLSVDGSVRRVLATPRLRLFGFSLLTAVAAMALGATVDTSTRTAFAAVGLLLLAALASQVTHLPATWVFAGAVVLSSALVDLPNRVHMGGFSANAGLTVAYAFWGVLVVILWRHSATTPATRPLRPFVALLIFALLSIGWGAPSITAVQNVLVLFIFIASVLCGSEVALNESVTGLVAAKIFGFGSIVALTLYVGSLAIGRLGAGSIIGSRSFALFALVVLAWAAAGWRYGAKFSRSLTFLSGLLILLSLSRTAFAAALIILCLAWFNSRSVAGWSRLIAAIGGATAIAYLAVQHIRPLHDRIYAGDVRSVGGGISINVEGRTKIWETTWHSYLGSPVFGHGVGTADSLISRVYGSAAGHPHNDYLRLLHDYGLVGMSLWAMGYAWLLRSTWRSWQRPPEAAVLEPVAWAAERRVHAAAFLSLIGVALAMVTDNVIVYMFVMAPLGVLVGFSQGLSARTVAPLLPPPERRSGYG